MASRSCASNQGARAALLVSKAGATSASGRPRQSSRAARSFSAPRGPASRPPGQRASRRPAEGRKSTSTRKTRSARAARRARFRRAFM
eukprot:15478088-Alexandrium_andersonii.AAC.1